MTKKIEQKVEIDTGTSVQDIKAVEKAAREADKALQEVDESEITVDVDQALKRLADIERETKALKDEKVSIRAELDASGFASELNRVKGDLKGLDDTKTTVKVDADVDGFRRKVQDAEDDVKRLGGEKSVSAIRDLSGPLGEVSSAVGDFGESFVAAGEVIGTQMGLSEDAIGKLAGFLGPAGIAAGAVFYFWNAFKENAEKARQKVREVEAAQRSLASLQYDEATKQILEGIGDAALDAAEKLGVSTGEIVKYVTGQTDAIKGLTDVRDDEAKALETVNRLQEDLGLTYNEALAVVKRAISGVDGYRTTWQQTNGTLKEADRRQFEALKAVNATTDAFLGLAERALPEARQEILDYVAATEEIPADVTTRIKALPDNQQVEATRAIIDGLAADRKAGVKPFVQGSASFEAEMDYLTRSRTIPVTASVTWRNAQGQIGGRDGPTVALGRAAVPSGTDGTARLSIGLPAASVGVAGGPIPVHQTFSISVNVAPGTDPIATGRAVVDAIKAYERLAGSTWRT